MSDVEDIDYKWGDEQKMARIFQLTGYVGAEARRALSPQADALLTPRHIKRVWLVDRALEIEFGSPEAMLEFGHLFIEGWRQLRYDQTQWVSFFAPKTEHPLTFDVTLLGTRTS
ncbi:hypothetical protein [Paraburkholderia sp. SIMBA_054]|uniref:hypothetical protein n=1 Tax=Paraburkholderia sp. SIMBA_054 TaxID=3085795 RepID=UPI003979133A